jgi:hypothetical protein
MRRSTVLWALALVVTGLAGAAFFLQGAEPIPDRALGSPAAPTLRDDSDLNVTRLTWTEPVGLVGVAIAGAGNGACTEIEIGGQRFKPRADVVWLDPRCRPSETRPETGACKTLALRGSWSAGLGQLTPIYAGTRVFWRSLGPRALELLRAYGVRPLAPAPESLSGLRGTDVLIVPHVGAYTTPARVLALAPKPTQSGELRSVPSLRTQARLLPEDEGARVVLGVDGVPILVAHGRDVHATVDIVATVDRLRFGWGPGGVDVDGNGEIQPRDAFPGLRAEDVAVPGTDLLVEAVLGAVLTEADPRVSWVPAGAPAVLLLTADQDYAPAVAVLAQSEAAKDVGFTVLLTTPTAGREPDVSFKDPPTGLLGRGTVATLLDRGHGIGIHPFVGLAPDGVTNEVAAQFLSAYGRPARVVRNHHITWHGHDTGPRQQSDAGLGLGLDYIAQASGGSDLGFLGGTGVPSTYPGAATLHLPTQLDDHVLLPARFGYRPYDVAALRARSRQVLDVAVRHRSVVVANHHPIWWIETDGAWQRALIDAAAERGIPVWGATDYLRYIAGARRAVLWRDGQRWVALVPDSGLSVVLDGVARELTPGARVVESGERQK